MKTIFLNLLIFIFSMFLLNGCAAITYDEDLDGIQNNKDLCLGTPKNIKVDKYGCALDSDFDGVLDVYDQCPNTKFSDMVNSLGCKL